MSKNRVLSSEELLEQIFDYMNRLVSEKDFEENVRILTDMGRTLVSAERASLWYWDKSKEQYWTLAASDSGKLVVPEGSGIVGTSIKNNETIVINNPYEDERFNPQVDRESGFVTKSILCMPITNTRGEVIGAYQVINKFDEKGDAGFDEVDEKRLAMAAVYSGKALESYLLYQTSIKDPLTGLLNRRGFYEYYEDNINQTLQTDRAAVIMCDIDFFKKVNDTYGHNAGDAVLSYVADILKGSVENTGNAIRWGGEEFVLLLPGKNIDDAYALAEEIRKRVEASVCRFEEQTINITMSFGVNDLDKEKTPDTNIEQVDEKLYKAKQSGRNRVIR
jgi:diguanylate cyclase (GGDEF)-like protein